VSLLRRLARLFFGPGIPKISILIPAFEAEKFICETLDSIAEQSFTDFEIIISIDASSDETGCAIEKWCRDHGDIRTEVIHQRHRLGQIRNVNFLLGRCESKYFMIMPHDDLLHKDYLRELIQCLEANDQAILAFSDIQAFGDLNRSIVQEPTQGNRLERTLHYLRNNAGAEPFRGLVNRTLLPEPVFLFGNDCSDFAADTTWVIRLAMQGELIRVPEVLYQKRFHANSLFSPWETTERSEKSRAWLEHCRDCLKVVSNAGFSAEELDQLVEAIQSRLIESLWYRNELDYDEAERGQLLTALESTMVDLAIAIEPPLSRAN
jgi:glycosyltransferase involved in cell wall biosynthesis